MDEVYTLVTEWLAGEGPPSRNRDFEAYKHPVKKRAIRIWRHLSTLAQELRDLDARGGGPGHPE